MPRIGSKVVIRASMPRVFVLIARPDEFAKYSEHIVQVVPLGDGAHHWEVSAAGVTLEWNSVITERRRPKYLAWRSTTGIQSSGSFALAQTKLGTTVTFDMEYQLPSKILDEVAAPMLEPLIQVAVTEVLEGIKGRLENDAESGWSPSDDNRNGGESR
jgi:uncharacterized membrane protein